MPRLQKKTPGFMARTKEPGGFKCWRPAPGMHKVAPGKQLPVLETFSVPWMGQELGVKSSSASCKVAVPGHG